MWMDVAEDIGIHNIFHYDMHMFLLIDYAD